MTSPSPSPFPTDDEFARVFAAAAGGVHPAGSELDELWRWVLDDELRGAGGNYESPAAVVSYRTGMIPDTPCAASTTVADWKSNAAYCPVDHVIYYDEDWLRDFQAHARNFAPVAILAHEWGHHVADLTGIEVAGRKVWPELQADCLAGVFLGQREKIENGTYVLADQDLIDALTTFFELGDKKYSASKWFSPQYHGSALQRLMAFGTGYLGATSANGPFGRLSNYFPWCYGYRDFAPRDVVDVGPYRLLVPPGREATALVDGYRMNGLTADGLTSATIDLYWSNSTETDPPAFGQRQFQGFSTLIGVDQIEPMQTSVGELRYVLFQGDGPVAPVSGFFGVFPPTEAGTLAIAVYRNEAAPTGLDDPRVNTLAEEVAAMAHIAGRLCAPGKSGMPGPDFSAPCSDQQ